MFNRARFSRLRFNGPLALGSITVPAYTVFGSTGASTGPDAGWSTGSATGSTPEPFGSTGTANGPDAGWSTGVPR